MCGHLYVLSDSFSTSGKIHRARSAFMKHGDVVRLERQARRIHLAGVGILFRWRGGPVNAADSTADGAPGALAGDAAGIPTGPSGRWWLLTA
jgi:hypothetical protein